MRKILVMVAGLLMIVSLVIAQEEPGEDFEDEDAEVEEEFEEEEDDEGEIEAFDRNVRLDFKIIPLEENDKGMFVITAVPGYETGVSFRGEGHEVEVEIEGEIGLRDDGRIFVFYDAHMAWEGNDAQANFYASSGVLLKPGRELEVSRFGKKTLVIKASYVDEEPEEGI